MYRLHLIAASPARRRRHRQRRRPTIPTQPITVLVPHAAGGPTDTVARLVGRIDDPHAGPAAAGRERRRRRQHAGHRSRRPGRAGRLHAAAQPRGPGVKRLACTASCLTIPAGAFDGIGLITDVPMTIVARADFAPNTIGELLDYIRANKDNVTYAHAGVGSASHLCGMLLHGRDRRADDHGSLQGHRPGDDRSSGRPGRHDVRPDHQHRRPDQGRQDQGLCRDDQGAAGRAARSADAGRSRASRASR